MKRSLTCLLILLFSSVQSVAEEAGTKCVTTDSDIAFVVKDAVKADANLARRYPVVKTSENGKPLSLEWVAMELGTLSESEKIAEIGGKEISRFVVWKDGKNKNGDGIVCVWFGIQDAAPSGYMGYRPFLIFPGDNDIRWWESYCSYNEKDGFTVRLMSTVKGTGVYWQESSVGFKKGEPSPLRIRSGGRGIEEPHVRKYR
ncbi:hypothetical protein [Prosthecobacter sp.]|uniref:hypothetical protein n=1 Tax=Prosthecobacter sp. TaxID=1965333 RepID=UPI003784ABBD